MKLSVRCRVSGVAGRDRRFRPACAGTRATAAPAASPQRQAGKDDQRLPQDGRLTEIIDKIGDQV